MRKLFKIFITISTIIIGMSLIGCNSSFFSSESERETVEEGEDIVEITVEEEVKEYSPFVPDVEENTITVPNKKPSNNGSTTNNSSSNSNSNENNNTNTNNDIFSLIIENEIFKETNNERIANGLPPLKRNSTANELAREKSKNMFTKAYFSHTDPDLGTLFDIANSRGISYKTMGENIYNKTTSNVNSVTGKSILTSWLSSEGHKKNILNGNFKEIGIGVVIKDGKIYATQVFYTP